ncbi:TetR/AcrR family transcriptional regulator [Oenococcus sicerae]|uniref:TetR/AcrR family transcriptional regulator n=1 Tax=Oenococcus sicerae TaxID=2203724 RepID=UPI0010B91B6A|nr:hypothetical protein OAL24_00207 [Oenococcus sicerae]
MNGKQRLAEQSRRWFWEAFVALLEEKNYQEISISEIAARAQLARRTFYRSFKSKEDLLDYYCHGKIAEYLDSLKESEKTSNSFDDLLLTFFEFWWQERRTLRLLIKNNLFSSLLEAWTPQSVKIYDLFQAPWHIQGTQIEIEYIMSFSTGGFWNILNSWLNKKNPEPAQQLASTLSKALNRLMVVSKD